MLEAQSKPKRSYVLYILFIFLSSLLILVDYFSSKEISSYIPRAVTFEINLNTPINSIFHAQKKQFMGFLNGASSSDKNKLGVRLYCTDFESSYLSNKPIVLPPCNPDKLKKF